jgi:excisionase family DNA binding protein
MLGLGSSKLTDQTEEILTVREAARFLKVSVNSIRRYIRLGRLPAYRIADERVLRIKRSDLERLLTPVPTEALQEADVEFGSEAENGQ